MGRGERWLSWDFRRSGGGGGGGVGGEVSRGGGGRERGRGLLYPLFWQLLSTLDPRYIFFGLVGLAFLPISF